MFFKKGRIYQYFGTLFGTIAMTITGMHYAWPSPSLSRLQEDSGVTLTNEEGAWLASMPFVGGIFGALAASVTVERFGRRTIMLFLSLPYLCSWLSIGATRTAAWLYAARFTAGVCDGYTYTCLPIYVGEIADPKIRALLASFMPSSMILGQVYINVIGSYYPVGTAAFISAALPALMFATFFWMPESPYYLVMKGRPEEARRALSSFRGTDDVDAELASITEAVRQQKSETSGTKRLRPLDLIVVPHYRAATIVIIVLRTAQQFSGITAVTLYAQRIFEESGGSVPPKTAAILINLVQLVATIVFSVFVDRFGRRPLLFVSTAGTVVGLVVLGTYFYLSPVIGTLPPWLPISTVIFYMIFYSAGASSMPVLMLGELFPANEIKSFAVGLLDIYFSVLATVVTALFQTLTDTFGMYFPFWLFAFIMTLNVLLAYLYVPETKGKTLEEIQCMLRDKSTRSRTVDVTRF